MNWFFIRFLMSLAEQAQLHIIWPGDGDNPKMEFDFSGFNAHVRVFEPHEIVTFEYYDIDHPSNTVDSIIEEMKEYYA